MQLVDLATSLVRSLPPETAHRATIQAMKRGLGVPAQRPVGADAHKVKLPVSGLELPNPIGLAAGFDKNAEAFSAMLGFGFGFVECGTVTPEPQPGNPTPRLFRNRSTTSASRAATSERPRPEAALFTPSK